MRNSTRVLVPVVLAMTVAFVACAFDDWRLRQQVRNLESELRVIDPTPVGPTTLLPMSWVRWLYKTPVPRSALALIIRPSPPERLAWRICFAPEALEQNPDFPEEVKRQLIFMRDNPHFERDPRILSAPTLLMRGRKRDPNGILDDLEKALGPLRPSAQPAGPSSRR